MLTRRSEPADAVDHIWYQVGTSRQNIASGYAYEDEYGYSRVVRVSAQCLAALIQLGRPQMELTTHETAGT